MPRFQFRTLTCFEPGEVCKFCLTDLVNEAHVGPIYKLSNITVHYFCLLMASSIKQVGKDQQGILGFLIKDIKEELVRGSTLVCSYCKKFGATIKCCVRGCGKIFHLPCGQAHGSLHQFYKAFQSFCGEHRLNQIVPNEIKRLSNGSCLACTSRIKFRDLKSFLWVSCCGGPGFFHRECMQIMASSAGYYFKCPLCNCQSKFYEEMWKYGIFIPEREAVWEQEPNAYGDLLERNNTCSAEPCHCLQGIDYSKNKSDWQIILCEACGGSGTHLKCIDTWTPSKGYNISWLCPICGPVITTLDDNKKNSPRKNDTPQPDVAAVPESCDNGPSLSRENREADLRTNADEDDDVCTISSTSDSVVVISDTDSDVVFNEDDNDIPGVPPLGQTRLRSQMKRKIGPEEHTSATKRIRNSSEEPDGNESLITGESPLVDDSHCKEVGMNQLRNILLQGRSINNRYVPEVEATSFKSVSSITLHQVDNFTSTPKSESESSYCEMKKTADCALYNLSASDSSSKTPVVNEEIPKKGVLDMYITSNKENKGQPFNISIDIPNTTKKLKPVKKYRQLSILDFTKTNYYKIDLDCKNSSDTNLNDTGTGILSIDASSHNYEKSSVGVSLITKPVKHLQITNLSKMFTIEKKDKVLLKPENKCSIHDRSSTFNINSNIHKYWVEEEEDDDDDDDSFSYKSSCVPLPCPAKVKNHSHLSKLDCIIIHWPQLPICLFITCFTVNKSDSSFSHSPSDTRISNSVESMSIVKSDGYKPLFKKSDWDSFETQAMFQLETEETETLTEEINFSSSGSDSNNQLIVTSFNDTTACELSSMVKKNYCNVANDERITYNESYSTITKASKGLESDPSHSSSSTFLENNYLLIDRFSYRMSEPVSKMSLENEGIGSESESRIPVNDKESIFHGFCSQSEHISKKKSEDFFRSIAYIFEPLLYFRSVSALKDCVSYLPEQEQSSAPSLRRRGRKRRRRFFGRNAYIHQSLHSTHTFNSHRPIVAATIHRSHTDGNIPESNGDFFKRIRHTVPAADTKKVCFIKSTNIYKFKDCRIVLKRLSNSELSRFSIVPPSANPLLNQHSMFVNDEHSEGVTNETRNQEYLSLNDVTSIDNSGKEICSSDNVASKSGCVLDSPQGCVIDHLKIPQNDSFLINKEKTSLNIVSSGKEEIYCNVQVSPPHVSNVLSTTESITGEKAKEMLNFSLVVDTCNKISEDINVLVNASDSLLSNACQNKPSGNHNISDTPKS